MRMTDRCCIGRLSVRKLKGDAANAPCFRSEAPASSSISKYRFAWLVARRCWCYEKLGSSWRKWRWLMFEFGAN